jgi:hypothetical protein
MTAGLLFQFFFNDTKITIPSSPILAALKLSVARLHHFSVETQWQLTPFAYCTTINHQSCISLGSISPKQNRRSHTCDKQECPFIVMSQ